jgi:hypothetical protein
MEKPTINPVLFWDTEISKIDWEAHASYIIERVLTRGNLQDWSEIKRYYGLERIKNEALDLRYLDKMTLNFCSLIFKTPESEFRCYNTPQSIKTLWNV